MYTKTFYVFDWVPLELIGPSVPFSGILLSSRIYQDVVGILLGPIETCRV
jgi:hypothetical protein